MIKNVIKRDGSIQEFDAGKLNNWISWASEKTKGNVDWTSVVLRAVSTLPEKVSSVDIQERLIKECLDRKTWAYNAMAGRLYAPMNLKSIHGGEYPTVKELHTKLQSLGQMVDFGVSDDDYAYAEKVINHSKNLTMPYFQQHYIINKYALKNRVAGTIYETPQFVFMRMALELSVHEPDDTIRKEHIKKFYDYLSDGKLNAPTPNYTNLGTKLRGFASCNVMTTNDAAASLAAHDHIAYTMTYMSAGIGSHINSRSLRDPVRHGQIAHLGKLPLYRALSFAVKAMTQNSRGGSATTYYSCFDPEVETIMRLKNPMSTEDKKIRGLDYAIQTNELFAKKVAKNEDIFLFNSFTAPDLYAAFYSGDEEKFEELYTKYENNRRFKKKYVNAREILLTVMEEGYSTGRAYLHFPAEANRHTPFREPIYSSNLCVEIELPTKGYDTTADLYQTDHERGEVALCSLAAICVDKITSDEEYQDVMYYALSMIDRCIHLSHYELPHVGYTAKNRLNAGVGIIGLAHYLAKNKLKYSSQEGKDEIHRLSEKHIYFAIKASLRLGKELGNAPWINKTKWPEGWMPIDTYNRNVDSVITVKNELDWETLRKEVIENGGIRNSVLVAHMPSESSSKASGTTNGVYPVRDTDLKKVDASIVTYWSAPDSDRLSKHYEVAWNIDWKDMIDVYAIIQKFTDQGISADLWADVSGDTKIGSVEMIKQYLYIRKMGMKSRYYVNSKTSNQKAAKQTIDTDLVDGYSSDVECSSCTL